MATGKPEKRSIFRWMTFRGLVAILFFSIVVVFIEYLVVLYSTNLGVMDDTSLSWNFQFPGFDSLTVVSVSPLFHLVPITVIVSLLSSWVYFTRNVVAKTPEKWEKRGKRSARLRVGREKKQRFMEFRRAASKMRDSLRKMKLKLLRAKGVAYLWERLQSARTIIKSGVVVLLVFGAVVLLVSLLTYPQLIYWIVSSAYQNNPSLLRFMKSVGNIGGGISGNLAPIGWISTAGNNALLSIAPASRGLFLGLGDLIKPLVELDGASKYLIFQNLAAWVSAFIALLSRFLRQRSFRHRRGRRRQRMLSRS